MDEKIINQIKALGIDMIDQAKSGHPGIVLGAAPILYTLYSKHIHVCKEDKSWPNRDRFILSAGHGSALLYATLFMSGLDYTIEDMKAFRQIHSRTPGHPEIEASPYIEGTTGPLGQGLAMAVGMALSQKILSSKFLQKTGENLFDYYTYVLCGDGDLMEGISYEASSFAGAQNLDHLIVLYDSNRTTLDHKTDFVFEEDIQMRFKAMGWHTIEVQNGNDWREIDEAIRKAKKTNKPSLIEVHTTIGKDSLLEDTTQVHGSILSKEDIKQLKHKWGIERPFSVNPLLQENFNKQIQKRSDAKYQIFQKQAEPYKEELDFLIKDSPISISFDSVPLEESATRISNGKLMQSLASQIPFFIGGSADLSSSNKTYLEEMGDLTRENPNGRNILFGVREHAMGAILNGLSMSHFRCFGSTFLVFSDYMKPAIRLSALMKRPICYIFTHDSISVGEDGPTHEPIEHIPMLRAIPNLYTFRPCDERELRGCWKEILASTQTPSALLLSRTGGSIIPGSDEEKSRKGAYILRKEKHIPQAILVSTGTEVETAYHIAEALWKEKQIDLRVVSMPSLEIFQKQSEIYQKEILPQNIIKIVIEASSQNSFIPDSTHYLTLQSFGYSGKAIDVKKTLHFTEEEIKYQVERLVKS